MFSIIDIERSVLVVNSIILMIGEGIKNARGMHITNASSVYEFFRK